MPNEVLMASVKELREAYLMAVRNEQPVLAEYWRLELVDRVEALSVAIGNRNGTKEAD